eukprot:m.171251 g.171251  ORF g.171251 m.171251 type:complete len:84 (+) comp39052_c0_seq50:401-652(+)
MSYQQCLQLSSRKSKLSESEKRAQDVTSQETGAVLYSAFLSIFHSTDLLCSLKKLTISRIIQANYLPWLKTKFVDYCAMTFPR